MLVCLYVDDILYMGSSLEMLEEFKVSMMKLFDMTDLGVLHYFLGLEVKQEAGKITVSQCKYARELLKRGGMSSSNGVPTPVNTNEELQLNDGCEYADGSRYRKIVGGLIYLTHTRPDIMFVV